MKTVEGKVVLLGSQGVGKTSLVTMYLTKFFNTHNSPTIGAAYFTCNIKLEDTIIRFQLWDTAGQERFRSMAPMYYRNSNVAFLIFDITNPKTFVNIKTWVLELRRNVQEKMVLILIGNKLDLAALRKVDSDEAKVYADSIGALYYEISALTNEGVDKVFSAAAAGLKQLASGKNDLVTSLKIYDNLEKSEREQPDVPLSEEPFTTSIAHGIEKKPFLCC
ncbi:hypothetical protein TKK_0011066 [Trichogramma kaykai]|uniref:Uncharacterized protein n=1 Tax=Trichogramma kaykai TaxID=54128 RepID=A0ABD2WUJ7_9HYME